MKNLFIVDLASYNEINNKPRMEASMGALLGYMDKVGQALGGFLLSLMLSMAGYDGALEAQPGSALMMIRMTMSVIPAIASIVCAFLLYRGYKLDKILKEHAEKQSA